MNYQSGTSIHIYSFGSNYATTTVVIIPPDPVLDPQAIDPADLRALQVIYAKATNSQYLSERYPIYDRLPVSIKRSPSVFKRGRVQRYHK